MDETEFNTRLRNMLRAQGMSAIHVREADVPGVLDLVVWKRPNLFCWIELKVDDEVLRPSQKEFIRDHVNDCLIMRYLNATGWIEVTRPPLGEAPSCKVALLQPDWEKLLLGWMRIPIKITYK